MQASARRREQGDLEPQYTAAARGSATALGGMVGGVAFGARVGGFLMIALGHLVGVKQW